MKKYVDNWFHIYETAASFQAHLNGGFINPDAICFIKETNQIYAQGTMFGICRKRYEELESLVSRHCLIIKNILGEEGPSVSDGIINNLKELTDFLIGYSSDTTLKEVLLHIQDTLESQIAEVASGLESAYRHITGRIDSLSTSVSESIALLNSKIETNKASILELKVEQGETTSTLQDHIRDWEEFKRAYDTFYTYVNNRFSSIDENYHSQHESILSMHEEIEALKSTVNEFDNKIDHCVALVNTCQVLVNNVESNFDSLSQDVADFFNTKGHPNGIAPLDSSGKVASAYLPSYVDDVLEYPSTVSFPEVGEDGKIYVAIDNNLTYRWGGTSYVEISKSLSLGETSSTAYPGDKGKLVTNNLLTHKSDYSNPHKVSKSQLGLDKVNNTSDIDKPISTATKNALDLLSTSLETHILDEGNPHKITKDQISLGNVDNTSDADKPLSLAQEAALDTKVDKIIGKGLSTNDFSNEYKSKLDGALSIKHLSEDELSVYENQSVGEIVYNTSTNKYVYWDGKQWANISSIDESVFATKEEVSDINTRLSGVVNNTGKLLWRVI